MNKSDSIAELAKALSKAQGDFGPLVKGSENPFFRSRYSDLATVLDVARGPLAENGLCVVQTTEETDPGFILLETTIIHTSGEWLSGKLKMPVVKSDPQGYGSCITYTKRYALQAILGLASEDDDAESAMQRKKEPEKKSEKKPPPSEPAKKEHPSEPLTVRGIVDEVSVKSGEAKGKPWTRYGVQINGVWYGTFSQTIGDSAESCKGAEVVVSYSTDGQHQTIIELIPVAVNV